MTYHRCGSNEEGSVRRNRLYMMSEDDRENHLDTESTQILGDWVFPQEVETERGSSRGGRVLPPWIDPSYEWGGGKWKEDGRKKKKKKEEKKESEGASDLSLEDLMDEYSSLPPQIAEWFWCIEYVAKFVKDLRCILDLMNMGYPCTNDYGRRISEVLSLRVLEFMFGPSKNDATGVGVDESRVEFDLSLSNTDVLNAICKDLRDVSLMENETTAAPPTEENDPVFRDEDDRMQTNEKDEVNVIDEQQQVYIGAEQTNINDRDEVTVINDEDDQMQTNEKDVIDGEPIHISITNERRRRRRRAEDARVKCTKDGTWLISGSDDESEDMVKGPPQNIPSRAENVCWKCEKEGRLLLVCSRSECAAKVHRECLNCPVNIDEDGSFHCPLCWYSRVTMEYLDSHKLMSCAKTRLVKFLPLLSRASNRLG
ncbi:unnamed protein product [Thlaspi arvense]|uniref:Zinc finger PHD-type domain-containing protein n=1 Tax=Thlaspi arvense TaxID=13288 RepID=A0AAU9R3Q0_THLAR|nr:unnamed protein product [Thlaspi arvense]